MNNELIEILKPAYEPCRGLESSCKNHIQWNPSSGHIPRGFCGAYGNIKDIELVLVLAEPGDPDCEESYPTSNPDETINYHNNYVTFKGGGIFHQNIRQIISLCYPNLSIEDAFHKVWITESVLCSTPITQTSTGRVPACVVDECNSRYLIKQKNLLKHAYWVAVGAKARDRLNRSGLSYDFVISHPAPPEGNKERAYNSWVDLSKQVEFFRSSNRNLTSQSKGRLRRP